MNDKPAEEFARDAVDRLLRIARVSDPQLFKGFFMGAIVINVIGNMPEDYFERFVKAEPCNQPSCDCHKLAEACASAFRAMREDFQNNTPQGLSA